MHEFDYYAENKEKYYLKKQTRKEYSLIVEGKKQLFSNIKLKVFFNEKILKISINMLSCYLLLLFFFKSNFGHIV